jgi:glycosyltransferase involved in cell wall biosynthesis
MKESLTIFIPAFNESKNIEKTIATINKAHKTSRNLTLEIIIVNDGSTDDTGLIADKLSRANKTISVIHNKENQGLGAGFRKALSEAHGKYFLFVPGDNDLPRELLSALFKNAGQADLVVSYFLNREVRGRIRNTISTLYNTIYMITFGVFLFYINGPCVYPTERLRKANLKSNRFSIVVEATIKLLCSGGTFLEVAGHLQTGAEGSTALSFRNLTEVFKAYFALIWEVKIKNRHLYMKVPVRAR